MDINIVIISLLIVMIIGQAGAIYLLLLKKRFHITSESATQDIERFLNSLDEEVAERGIVTQKYLQTFSKELQEHEEKRIVMLDQVNNSVDEAVHQIQSDTNSGREEIKKIVALLNEMLKKHLDDVSNNIGTMKEEVSAVKELTLEKEEKIRRYEDGYDQKNIKQFYKDLFKILEFIRKERYEKDNIVLEEIQEDLLLMLENNGIEKIEIDEGVSYEGHSKVAKVIDTEETNDPSKDLLIKEVKKDGYFVQVDDEMQRVIRPAEVIVYKLNQAEEGE